MVVFIYSALGNKNRNDDVTKIKIKKCINTYKK